MKILALVRVYIFKVISTYLYINSNLHKTGSLIAEMIKGNYPVLLKTVEEKNHPIVLADAIQIKLSDDLAVCLRKRRTIRLKS